MRHATVYEIWQRTANCNNVRIHADWDEQRAVRLCEEWNQNAKARGRPDVFTVYSFPVAFDEEGRPSND